MGFTREQLDTVESEIATLKAGTFTIGERSVDQEKTLAALIKLRNVIKSDLAGRHPGDRSQPPGRTLPTPRHLDQHTTEPTRARISPFG